MEVSDASVKYEVPVESMAALRKKLAVLSARAVKLGQPPITLTEGRTFEKQVRVRGRKAMLPHVEVVVEGSRPKLADWHFIAALRHLTLEDGRGVNLVLRSPYANMEVPTQYRTVPCRNCDHCGRALARQQTYLVHHPQHGFRQVGGVCLADFLGHEDPHNVAAYLEVLLQLDDVCLGLGWDDEGEGGGASLPRVFSLRTYLCYVAGYVRLCGWHSRREDLPTADEALEWMFPRLGHIHPSPEAQDEALADEALAWARGLGDNAGPLSDFHYNLWVVVQRDFIQHESIGIAASIIPAYQRELVRRAEQARAAAESRYFGQVGERLEVQATCTREPLELPGRWGTKYLYRFVTAEGQVAVWFSTSRVPEIQVGKPLRLVGTVAKHQEYEGVQQTALTRVKVLPEGEPAKHSKPRRKAAPEAR